MSSWHSYPKIFNMGHPGIRELFDDEVLIEEKVDGAQFSFGVFNGEIKARSKGKELEPLIKEKLFQWAWPKVARAIVGGLPQWYKEELAKTQFISDEKL